MTTDPGWKLIDDRRSAIAGLARGIKTDEHRHALKLSHDEEVEIFSGRLRQFTKPMLTNEQS